MVRPHKNTWIIRDTKEDRETMRTLIGDSFCQLFIDGLRTQTSIELIRIKWGDGKIIAHRRLNDIKIMITHYE